MAESIYLHVPFCEGRCAYCTFYSGEDLSALEEYPRLLIREMELLHSPEDAGEVKTIYLGGGTPGLLGERGLSEILDGLGKLAALVPDAEITAETNPAITNDYKGIRRSGVRRLSLGVQALDDGLLKKLGRKHDAKEALKAVESALAEGLELSCDLMYGYPGLKPEVLASWGELLAGVGVGHISAYSLEIPQNKAQRDYLRNLGIKSDAKAEEKQWSFLFEALAKKGFECYEVSNFALPGKASRHNRNYWSGKSYTGLGPGAHGFLREGSPFGTRYWNEPSLEKYRAALLGGHPPPRKTETLSRREALLETLFLSLRQRKPLDAAALSSRYGLDEARLLGLLKTLAESGDLETGLLPTPKGMRRADGLALWLSERLL
ncbi:coproporphyrinogen III oxidase family protein [bacterium]|nr:MAG: coproporphyrinogen III oxidase family protein [bacterium]